MTFNLSSQALERSFDAQATVYESVFKELSAGRKSTHWMWFIFPQLKELGHSQIAKYYGIASAAEARAYWQDPILGTRLIECTQLILAHSSRTVHDIFGSPDDLKFWSCMTLFAHVAPAETVFRQALARFFDGRPDEATVKYLRLK